MEFRQIKAFIAIYEQGSVSKAAKELFIAQQTLSQALASLEDELGVSLFMRSQKGSIPTKEAEELLPLAYDILKTNESFNAKLEKLKENHSVVNFAYGRGCFGAQADLVLKELILEAKEVGIELKAQCAAPAECVDLVEEGQVDLALMVKFSDEKVLSLAITELKYLEACVLTASENPLVLCSCEEERYNQELVLCAHPNNKMYTYRLTEICNAAGFVHSPSFVYHEMHDPYIGANIEVGDFSLLAWRGFLDSVNTCNSVIVSLPRSEHTCFRLCLATRKADQTRPEITLMEKILRKEKYNFLT